MAFVQVPGGLGLIRDMWSQNLGRLSMDVKDFQDMAAYDTIPDDKEEMMDWAIVVPIPRPTDPSRRWAVIHNPPPEPSIQKVYPVTLRLQGILGKHDFRIFGSWDGTEANACKAMNSLVLVPGEYPDAFDYQLSAVENIRRFIVRVAGGNARRWEDSGEGIYCKKRVFTKFQVVSGTPAPSSALTFAEDAFGAARDIEDTWRVVDRIKFGRRLESGQVKSCKPHAFSEGDLVDVTASIDIVTITKRHGETATMMHLVPTVIVQLCTAERLAEIMPGQEANAGTAPPVQTVQFDGDGGGAEEE
ncbi:hypothetical protein FA95DRAFT_1577365 [Auriscalpium vulgare]|uniref:Uncharacterized protein n=1 Tax=Auriscalpium vulgare TaxID=40419 RepID=A0ACB8R7P1_9AGAM|nr:hypothetical protein FA95DRAFT_1577365 [Auriscalpium vulgare]